MWHALGNMAGVEGPSPRPDVSHAQTRGSAAEIVMTQLSLEPWDMSVCDNILGRCKRGMRFGEEEISDCSGKRETFFLKDSLRYVF